MQGRSRMAALTHTTSALLGLILGLGLPAASRADDTKTTPAPTPAPSSAPAPAPADSAPARVKLDLRISGLGPQGCDVEIAPGNMDCKFRPVRHHLSQHDANGYTIPFDDVRTTSADRNCMFAITIREPGQPVKTVRRGLRIVPASDEQFSAQLLSCYLSSPSKLAKASEMRERR
jgi:hypothetical protein